MVEKTPLPKLYPLEASGEYDNVEAELKRQFITIFEDVLRTQEREINLFGAPHLGSLSLIERHVIRDGLALLRSTDPSMRYLFKSWRARNPKRGMHFLRTYLQLIFPNNWVVSQLWQDKAKAYPLGLTPKSGVEADLEKTHYLTSRVRVLIDTEADDAQGVLATIPALRSIVPAKFVLEIFLLKQFASEFGFSNGLALGGFADFAGAAKPVADWSTGFDLSGAGLLGAFGAFEGEAIPEPLLSLPLFPDDFSNAAWVKARATIIPNAIAAPDGSLTADKLVEDATANNSHLVFQNRVSKNEAVYLSVYAKAGERNRLRISCSNFVNSSIGGVFNLVNGSFYTEVNYIDQFDARAAMKLTRDGWWKIELWVKKKSFNTVNVFQIDLIDQSTGSNAYSGNGASGLYLWRAQAKYTPLTDFVEFADNFTDPTWLKVGATPSLSAIAAPDATLTAYKLVEDSSNGAHLIDNSIPVEAGWSYTYSIAVKAGERTSIALTSFITSAVTDVFNLSAGAVTNNGSGAASIISMGNGWYLCSTTTLSTKKGTGYFDACIYNGSATYQGNGTSGLYLWRARIDFKSN